MTNSVQPTSGMPVETKGSVVRSLAATLVEHRLLDGIAAAVSPAARSMLRDPPLPTEWIDGRVLNEIFEVILQVHGADLLRRLNRQSIERGVSPLVRGAAESVLRVFGVSPATLLSRLGRVTGTMSRGVTYHYDPQSETSGAFDLEYPLLVDVPLGASIATVGGLELIFDMCSVRGSFGAPSIVPNGRRNRVRFPVTWRGARDR
jgi:hypothetical protein